ANYRLAYEALIRLYGRNRRDICAGVGVVRGQESIVEVQLTHRGAISKRGTLRGVVAIDAKDGRAAFCHLMALCNHTRGSYWTANYRSNRNRCVINDAVDDHVFGFLPNLNRVGRHLSYLVGQVFLKWEVFC